MSGDFQDRGEVSVTFSNGFRHYVFVEFGLMVDDTPKNVGDQLAADLRSAWKALQDKWDALQDEMREVEEILEEIQLRQSADSADGSARPPYLVDVPLPDKDVQ